MNCRPINSWCRALLILCFVFSFHKVHAQISSQRLDELRSKYDWGSIYLTYGSIPDIIQVVDNPGRIEKIKATFKASPPPGMIAFLTRYKSPTSRKSIALFQINFSASTPVAGFLTSNDINGTITRTTMPPQEVLAAADWVDLYLTHAAEWARLASGMSGGKAELKEAWNSIRDLSKNPFFSENRISSLLIVFRTNQMQNDAELESMKAKDPKLYGTLKLFAANYDAATTALMQKFLKRPGGAENTANRKKKNRNLTQEDLGPRGYLWQESFLVNPDAESFEDSIKLRIYKEYQKILEREPQE